MRKKLKLLMEQKGYTSTKLAEKSGVSRPYISQVLSGDRGLSEETLHKLLLAMDLRSSEATQLIAKWRLEDAVDKAMEVAVEVTDESKNASDILSKLGAKRVTQEDFISIPVLGAVSCGPFKESDVIGQELIEKTLIKSGKTYYILVANGLSMVGKIDHGDKLLIEQTPNNVPGKIMIFQIRDEHAAGYLYEEGGFYEIKKANRDYPPIKVNDPDFCIVGVVRQIVKINP